MSNNLDQASGSTEATATDTQGNITSPKRSLQMATAELWTTAEFLEAEPYPLPEVTEQMLKELQEASFTISMSDVAGAGNLDKGGAPEKATAEETLPAATAGGYNYPAPYTRYEVLCPYSIYPYVTVGKIFFKQNGGSYVASAASIGNYAIWTAGHCVHAGNGRADGWSTNLVFVPAYKDGSAPFGQWPASYLLTRTNWYQNGIPNGLSDDMGGAVLFPNSSGRKISEVVGWLGFAWNWSRFQHWLSLGYPARTPFNGARMHINAASYAYDGTVPGVKPVGIGNEMTQGCSGGPWVWQFGTGNYVNGNNSYFGEHGGQEMFSPYFDDRAKSLKDDLLAGKP